MSITDFGYLSFGLFNSALVKDIKRQQLPPGQKKLALWRGGQFGSRRAGIGRRGSLLHDGVEDADQLPVVFVFRDVLAMARMILVAVVIGLGLEDDMQGDIEVANVDRAVQGLRQSSHGEENFTRMAA